MSYNGIERQINNNNKVKKLLIGMQPDNHQTERTTNEFKSAKEDYANINYDFMLWAFVFTNVSIICYGLLFHYLGIKCNFMLWTYILGIILMICYDRFLQ